MVKQITLSKLYVIQYFMGHDITHQHCSLVYCIRQIFKAENFHSYNKNKNLWETFKVAISFNNE